MAVVPFAVFQYQFLIRLIVTPQFDMTLMTIEGYSIWVLGFN